jgi:hypothetical protein
MTGGIATPHNVRRVRGPDAGCLHRQMRAPQARQPPRGDHRGTAIAARPGQHGDMPFARIARQISPPRNKRQRPPGVLDHLRQSDPVGLNRQQINLRLASRVYRRKSACNGKAEFICIRLPSIREAARRCPSTLRANRPSNACRYRHIASQSTSGICNVGAAALQGQVNTFAIVGGFARLLRLVDQFHALGRRDTL